MEASSSSSRSLPEGFTEITSQGLTPALKDASTTHCVTLKFINGERRESMKASSGYSGAGLIAGLAATVGGFMGVVFAFETVTWGAALGVGAAAVTPPGWAALGLIGLAVGIFAARRYYVDHAEDATSKPLLIAKTIAVFIGGALILPVLGYWAYNKIRHPEKSLDLLMSHNGVLMPLVISSTKGEGRVGFSHEPILKKLESELEEGDIATFRGILSERQPNQKIPDIFFSTLRDKLGQPGYNVSPGVRNALNDALNDGLYLNKAIDRAETAKKEKNTVLVFPGDCWRVKEDGDIEIIPKESLPAR